MWRFWDDVRSHRGVASIFLLLWLGAWILSLGPRAWVRPDPFLTHFALAPFAAAFLAAWWQRMSGGSGLLPLSAPMVALLVAEAGWLISYSRLLLEVVSRSSQPELFSPGWAVPMYLSGAFIMGLAGLVAGTMGGLVGSLLAAGLRRLRPRRQGAGGIRAA
jgi:hypothetical protein